MKHLNKTLSVLLALMLCMALIPAAVAEDDLSQEANLVFYVMGDAPEDEKVVEDAINVILKEKFNATIDFQFSTWTDFNQKYNTQLTSGGADLIYIANWIDYKTLAGAGAFLELDDLLNQYAPELRALAGEEMLNMCRVEGELYAVPALWPEYVPLGIKYREDLRAKYDLPYPDSLENIEAYFAGVKANEPDQAILRCTTSESASSLNVAFDAANVLNIKYPWTNANGFPYGLTSNYETPDQIYDYWFSDDFVEDMKLMKKWADMGFWSKSALSDTNDSEAYNNGLCIAEVAGMNPNKQIASATTFAKEHPEWVSAYITYGEVTGVLYPGHATQNGTAIVRGTKYPERCAMVLNYLMTNEEMNDLVQYGIKGVHYDVVDGVYENLDTKFQYENFNTWNLRVNDYKLPQKSDVDLQAMFDKYNEIAQKSKFPNVNIYGGFNEVYADYEFERTAVSNVMRQYLAPIQAGLVDDVEAAVAEFRQKVMDAGLQKCRDAFTEQWLDYCEEFGYQ